MKSKASRHKVKQLLKELMWEEPEVIEEVVEEEIVEIEIKKKIDLSLKKKVDNPQ